jgi:hypothetical protein
VLLKPRANVFHFFIQLSNRRLELLALFINRRFLLLDPPLLLFDFFMLFQKLVK